MKMGRGSPVDSMFAVRSMTHSREKTFQPLDASIRRWMTDGSLEQIQDVGARHVTPFDANTGRVDTHDARG